MATQHSETRETLVYAKDRYIIPNEDGTYTYLKYKPGNLRNGNVYLEIEIAPHIMEEGYACYKNQLFKVTLRDLLRGQINVRSSTSAAGNPADATTIGNVTSNLGKPGSTSVEQRSEHDIGIPEDELANMAWKEQMRTLLDVLDQEE